MKERAQELKAAARKADGESAVLAKIAEMPKPDRAMGESDQTSADWCGSDSGYHSN